MGGIETGGGARTRETSGAPRPGRSDLIERQQRLTDLRCAAGVLEATLGSRMKQELLRRAKLLEESLLAPSDPRRAGDTRPVGTTEAPRETREPGSDLAGFDVELRSIAEVVAAGLGRAPLSQRRSLLVQLEGASRAAASTLLDLLIEEEGRLADRLAIVLDLITLLATEKKGDCRRVVRDPSSLTPKLRSLAERSGTRARVDLERTEQIFIEIAQRGMNAGGGVLAAELDARKTELGVSLLAPPVLRAVAFCDAMLWRPAIEGGGEARPAPPSTARPPSAASNPAPTVRRHEQQAISQPDGQSRSEAPSPALPAPSPTGFRWETGPATPARSGSARRQQPSASRATSRARTAAAVMGEVASLGLATHVWWEPQDEKVRTFSAQELAALSLEIASGYRSRSGAGPLFVGTVHGGWAERSIDERGKLARNMIYRLTSTGVREVLLLDESRRVAVHHADGLPLRIGPEEEAAS